LPTTDERRALKILREKLPDNADLVGQFLDFLRERHQNKGWTNLFPTPEDLANEFLKWNSSRSPLGVNKCS